MGAEHGNVLELAGSQDAEQLADFSANNAAIVAENQPIKPEIDLASWAALGGSVKPGRADRKPKRGWNRRSK